MKPIGPLMHEHRLIERMIAVINREVEQIKTKKVVDTGFIYTVVDFIRIYADKSHHGKEEDILFRDLEKKQLSDDHERIMKELIEEHVYGRKKVQELVDETEPFSTGYTKTPKIIASVLEELGSFYPKHIEKEDKHFFFPVMDYFTQEEQDSMLEEFYEFDRRMIHEKYRAVVEVYEGEIL